MNSTEAIQSLAALAHPLRLQLLRALVLAGSRGMTPGTMHEGAGVPPATLSFHLKELTSAGLVTQERSGRNLVYRAASDSVDALIAYLGENCRLDEAVIG